MAILIGEELRKALENGLIGVDPLDESQVGPGSVDLTLGNETPAGVEDEIPITRDFFAQAD